MSSTTNRIIENVVLKAHSARSGVDVVSARLMAEIRLLRPALETVEVSQVIDALDERNLGHIAAPIDEPGERLFSINHSGMIYPEELIERDRPKSCGERVKLIPRSDWLAVFALLVSLGSLAVSVLTFLNLTEKNNVQKN